MYMYLLWRHLMNDNSTLTIKRVLIKTQLSKTSLYDGLLLRLWDATAKHGVETLEFS